MKCEEETKTGKGDRGWVGAEGTDTLDSVVWRAGSEKVRSETRVKRGGEASHINSWTSAVQRGTASAKDLRHKQARLFLSPGLETRVILIYTQYIWQIFFFNLGKYSQINCRLQLTLLFSTPLLPYIYIYFRHNHQ